MRGVFRNEVEGLPYFNDFSFFKYSNSVAPREVVISYGSRLLPAVIFQSQRVMRNQGLENADDYVPFIGGLVGRIMNDPGILTELIEGGLNMQSLADLFSAGIDESTKESKYASDNCWQDVLSALTTFYGRNERTQLQKPTFLTAEWLLDLANIKTRKETRAYVVKLADEAGIELPNKA